MTTQRLPTSTNEAIVAFYNVILATDGQRFSKTDLINYLTPFGFGTTPATVERALRTLRNAGKINYFVAIRNPRIFQCLPLETAEYVQSGSGPQRTPQEIQQYNATFKD